MNVIGAWRHGYTGKGVVVTILDDGIEHSHSDLRENYVNQKSVFFLYGTLMDVCSGSYQ